MSNNQAKSNLVEFEGEFHEKDWETLGSTSDERIPFSPPRHYTKIIQSPLAITEFGITENSI